MQRGDDYAANENDYFDPSVNVKQEPVRLDRKLAEMILVLAEAVRSLRTVMAKMLYK